jgi:DNA-binding transcriptional LysR family regulator
MDYFQSIRVFAKVVEVRSFVRAALQLNMSAAATTRHIAHLESRLGTSLLNCTTRRVSLTAAGQAYLQRVIQILGDVAEADASKEDKVESRRKPKLLVAIQSKGVIRLTNALASDFDLVFCHSLADAMEMLNQNVDAVVCGTNFDDSRMFELIRSAKDTPTATPNDIPFIVVKVFEGVLHQDSYDSVRKASELLGAADFVDLAKWRAAYGKEEAARKFREIIHGLIARER